MLKMPVIILCKTCQHPGVLARVFSAAIISPARKGRKSDYQMVAFSSIEASVIQLKSIYPVNINTLRLQGNRFT